VVAVRLMRRRYPHHIEAHAPAMVQRHIEIDKIAELEWSLVRLCG
jgi:hypothetical protein